MNKLAIFLQPSLRAGLFAIVSIASTPVFATGLFASFDSQATLQFDAAFLPKGVSADAFFTPSGTDGGDFVWAQDKDLNPLDSAFYSVSASNPEADFGTNTTHLFSVQMDATAGYLMSQHRGSYWFVFANSDPGPHDLELTLNFDWSIILDGAYADSEIQLDLFDQDDLLLGFARYDGAFSYIEALGDSSMTNGSGHFKHNFTLDGGDIAFFIAELSVIGTLQPVPLPGAAWLFMSGVLAMFGYGKHRRSPMPSLCI